MARKRIMEETEKAAMELPAPTSVVITVEFPKTEFEQLEKMAQAEMRPVGWQVRFLIKMYLKSEVVETGYAVNE